MNKKYLVIFALFWLDSACNKTERAVATLPAKEVIGVESSGFNLYHKNTGGTPTALGQIFSAPEGHPYLTQVGFLCRGSVNPDKGSDVKVKLRVSLWDNDRPAEKSLWESEIVNVKSDIMSDWIIFDAPHVQLKPETKYIAWLALAGLDNADDASLIVVRMGPRTSTPPSASGEMKGAQWQYAYQEGYRAYWIHGNPEGLIDYMSEYPWNKDAAGHNLHFKMTFENRP